MVRREIFGVIHLLGVLTPAARGLRKKRDVSELHRGNDELPSEVMRRDVPGVPQSFKTLALSDGDSASSQR